MKTFKLINLLVIMLIAFSSHALAQTDKSTELRQKLSQLEAQLVEAKGRYEGSKKAYEEAKGTDKEANAKATFDNAYSRYQSLVNAERSIRKELDNLNKLDTADSIQAIETTFESSYIDTKINLLSGWNTFSVPVNQSLPTDHAVFKNSAGEKNYSVIWGYDKGTWIKNPTELKAAKGYYIYITAPTGSVLSFSGAGFATDLDSPVKEANTWYFLGASKPISDIDYTRFLTLSFKGSEYIKNPKVIETAEAFWAYKIK